MEKRYFKGRFCSKGAFVPSCHAELPLLSICSAFTLIELLVVVLIIGILTAVAVSQYQKAVLKSKYAVVQRNVNTLARGEILYYLERGTTTPYLKNLQLSQLTGCTFPDSAGRKIECADGTLYQSEGGYTATGLATNVVVVGIILKDSVTGDKFSSTNWKMTYRVVVNQGKISSRTCVSFDRSSISRGVCTSLGGVWTYNQSPTYTLPL